MNFSQSPPAGSLNLFLTGQGQIRLNLLPARGAGSFGLALLHQDPTSVTWRWSQPTQKPRGLAKEEDTAWNWGSVRKEGGHLPSWEGNPTVQECSHMPEKMLQV